MTTMTDLILDRLLKLTLIAALVSASIWIWVP
jgi:hypothetical protein